MSVTGVANCERVCRSQKLGVLFSELAKLAGMHEDRGLELLL